MLMLTLLVAACRKKPDPTEPTPTPITINITAPTAGQVVKSGEEVSLNATVSYASALHGCVVRITNVATGAIVFEKDLHTNASSMTVSEKWVNTVTTAADLRVDFVASSDDNSVEETESVTIKSLPANAGKVLVRFANMAGNQPMMLNTGTYQNAWGADLMFTKFNYYISNVMLHGDNTYTEVESYHLVQQDNPNTYAFELDNVPPGNYTGISFIVGVDSMRNVSGAQTGALDPNLGMFWTWSTGYIMAKLEGTSPQSSNTDKSFIYHVGGFAGPYNPLRRLNQTFPSAITVNNNMPKVYLHADALLWFTPNKIDVATMPSMMNISKESFQISQNYSAMFAVDSVRN